MMFLAICKLGEITVFLLCFHLAEKIRFHNLQTPRSARTVKIIFTSIHKKL